MTEKEKMFIESCNRRNILNGLYQKDFSIFFDYKLKGPIVVTKKKKCIDRKARSIEAQRNLFSGSFTRSRKKPRPVLLCTKPNIPQEVAILLHLEEFCDLVLKVKYRYSEVVVSEGDHAKDEYDPSVIPRNQALEHIEASFAMIKEHFTRLHRFKKFFSALSALYDNIDEDFQKNVILIVLENTSGAEFTASFKSFIEKAYSSFPRLSEDEVSEFFGKFHLSVAGVVLATVLILKAPILSKYLKDALNAEVLKLLFALPDKKAVWQLMSILSSSLGKKDKKDVVFTIRRELVEAAKDPDNENVDMFLRAVGIERKDLA